MSRSAMAAVDDARERMAFHLGCEPGEVVFTSGGTEADNLAILGVHAVRGGAAICSAIEHRAVLGPSGEIGAKVAPVGRDGILDLDRFEVLLTPEIAIVSVMTVNNEVGTVQPLAEISALVRKGAPGAVIHSDAVQAAAWLDLRDACRDVDALSVSAHKVGGPKGVGALVLRDGVSYSPPLRGGSHERGRRPGTHNVAGIVGMAAAFDAAAKAREEERVKALALRDRLVRGIVGAIDGVEEIGRSGSDANVPGILSLVVSGVDQQDLLLSLDEKGVCAAGGSACSSGAVQPSHVLIAMGYSAEEARGAVRLSLGHTTTVGEIDHAIGTVVSSVDALRSGGRGAR